MHPELVGPMKKSYSFDASASRYRRVQVGISKLSSSTTNSTGQPRMPPALFVWSSQRSVIRMNAPGLRFSPMVADSTSAEAKTLMVPSSTPSTLHSAGCSSPPPVSVSAGGVGAASPSSSSPPHPVATTASVTVAASTRNSARRFQLECRLARWSTAAASSYFVFLRRADASPAANLPIVQPSRTRFNIGRAGGPLVRVSPGKERECPTRRSAT